MLGYPFVILNEPTNERRHVVGTKKKSERIYINVSARWLEEDRTL